MSASHPTLTPSPHARLVFLALPRQVGYAALAGLVFGECAGLPVPGETALIAAGGLTAQGALTMPLVVVVATASAIAGDTLGYLVGRRYGRRILVRDGRLSVHRRLIVARADRVFARSGTTTVLLGRFVPGVRVVAAVLAGATRMPWRRFATANAIGAACWATGVATIARLAGPGGAIALAGAGLTLGAALSIVAAWRARRRMARLGSRCAAPSPSGPV